MINFPTVSHSCHQGASAACRGSSSIQVSNYVAKYLIQLAISGETGDPFDSNKRALFASSSQIQVALHVATASAYGSLISVDAGSPFWRQRLIHLALKEIQDVSISDDVQNPSFWGQLSLVAQVVACGNLSTMSDSVLSLLENTLTSHLLLMYPRNADEELTQLLVTPDLVEVQELVLAGIVKLIGYPRANTSKYVGTLIPAVLRLLSCANETVIGSKALALQILCLICSFDNEKALVVRFKPAVDSILVQALDHPSAAFRQMVAETRNHWAVLT